MENAAAAVSSLFAKDPASPHPEAENTNTTDSSVPTKSSDKDADSTTVDSEVAPSVEHTHVKKEHETREQTVVEKEKHQDHYHTTVQPLKDSETLPEKHNYTQETQQKSVNNDDEAGKAQAAADRAGFQSSSDEKQFESTTKEPTIGEEHVHHHLHETVQPVIEKRKLTTERIKLRACC
jgi:hypothetical protein